MNPSTALATVLVDELVRGGVREAVLSPGSRSAPLAFALHAADAAGRLRLHVRIDERSAGFLGLGLAKVSRSPVAVVTTSGTAAVNLHPAVVEASESGVPLVVLTADRPPELRATGANQTIDQIHLYGSSARLFHEVGVAQERAGQNAYWRSLVCRALDLAAGVRSADPGPVHLNLAFAEPLVPGQVPTTWPEALDGRPGVDPWTRRSPTLAESDPRGPDDEQPERTLVVVGDAPPELGTATAELAQAYGWPVVSEPSGNARQGPYALRLGHVLLADPEFVAANLPHRVLVVGRPTLHRGVSALLRRGDVRVEVVAPSGRPADAARTASVVHAALPVLPADPVGPPTAWAQAWLDADESAERALDQQSSAGARAVEAAVAVAVVGTLSTGSLLFAGSSMPIRDLSAARVRSGVTVFANRGAAGIDGTVSTAIGAALAWQAGGGGRAFALVGDLTFLHDAGALVIGPDEPRPDLTIVVVNNDGGAIFGLLEQGARAYAAAFERVFGTPHGADLAALCGASGTSHTRVSSPDELAGALADPRRDGLQVIEIRTSRP